MKFIVDQLFPRNKVHIIAGPSGSGKTTFIFNLIRDWSIGSPIFGFQSNPEPYLYISMDRDLDEVGNRIEAAGLDPAMIPQLALLEPDMTAERAIEQVPVDVRVLFIDGFARICPAGKLNDYRTVSNFCLKLGKLCKEKDLTIFAAAHSTKVKNGEEFLHQRHRVLGSVAWGGFTSTLVFIDEEEPGNAENTNRKVDILPRCAAPIVCKYMIDEEGGFVEVATEVKVEEEDLNRKFYTAIPANEDFKSDYLLDLAHGIGLSRRTAYRCLKEWVKAKQLDRPAKGIYHKEVPVD